MSARKEKQLRKDVALLDYLTPVPASEKVDAEQALFLGVPTKKIRRARRVNERVGR